MTAVKEIQNHLEERFPLRLAEDWDNTGLLIGRSKAEVRRMMTCLTITVASAIEAIDRHVDLIVSHHPLPFRATKKLTDDSAAGRLMLDLIENQIAVYSPHTSFDSAATGINQQFAEGLGLTRIAPLRPDSVEPNIGAARYGDLPDSIDLSELERRVMSSLSISKIRTVGVGEVPIHRVAVACGSAGEFLEDARRLGCQAFVTGETSFHTCLEAEATNVALLLPGHYATERFAVVRLADELKNSYPNIEIWASDNEADPIQSRDLT
jgi:dinuclear metal center YbgI/SA1388 family protein